MALFSELIAQEAEITLLSIGHTETVLLIHLFRYPEMMNLDVFNIEFLEITELSVSHKLAPAVGPILGKVLFIY